MNIREAIKTLLSVNGKSQSWLAEKMEYARASAINNMIARGNVEINTLIKICDVLEYEVTVQPKRKKGARPDGQIVIDEVIESESGKRRGIKRKEEAE